MKLTRKWIQIIALILLVFGALGIARDTNWQDAGSIMSFALLTLGALGSIIAVFIPTEYVLEFDESAWQRMGDEDYYTLIIPSHKHGHGSSPKVQVFRFRQNEGYRAVGTGYRHDEEGNITLNAKPRFQGKVVVS